MSKKKDNTLKAFLITLGIFGFIAGIFLTINGNKFLGISGSIASASIAFIGLRK